MGYSSLESALPSTPRALLLGKREERGASDGKTRRAGQHHRRDVARARQSARSRLARAGSRGALRAVPLARGGLVARGAKGIHGVGRGVLPRRGVLRGRLAVVFLIARGSIRLLVVRRAPDPPRHAWNRRRARRPAWSRPASSRRLRSRPYPWSRPASSRRCCRCRPARTRSCLRCRTPNRPRSPGHPTSPDPHCHRGPKRWERHPHRHRSSGCHRRSARHRSPDRPRASRHHSNPHRRHAPLRHPGRSRRNRHRLASLPSEPPSEPPSSPFCPSESLGASGAIGRPAPESSCPGSSAFG